MSHTENDPRIKVHVARSPRPYQRIRTMLDHEDWSQLSEVASLDSFTLVSTRCVSSDSRGGMGPIEITLRGGDDWKKDRHALPNERGARWYQIDWDETVWIASAVFDWETAHAERYELLLSARHLTRTGDGSSRPGSSADTLLRLST
jgi:hypothetical protein